MKFYKQQHEFYCGIDLHANSMHVCVVDHVGNKLLHKNFDTKKPERFLTAIRSYSKNDLIIGCESTFPCSQTLVWERTSAMLCLARSYDVEFLPTWEREPHQFQTI